MTAIHLGIPFDLEQYLADSVADPTLYPADARTRASINRWLFWCAQHFSPAINILNWEHSIKGMLGLGPADPEAVRRGEQAFREFGGVLDAHLASHEWICGTTVTLADLAIAAPLADRERAKLPVNDLIHLQLWFAQVRSLDAWRLTESPDYPSE